MDDYMYKKTYLNLSKKTWMGMDIWYFIRTRNDTIIDLLLDECDYDNIELVKEMKRNRIDYKKYLGKLK